MFEQINVGRLSVKKRRIPLIIYISEINKKNLIFLYCFKQKYIN